MTISVRMWEKSAASYQPIPELLEEFKRHPYTRRQKPTISKNVSSPALDLPSTAVATTTTFHDKNKCTLIEFKKPHFVLHIGPPKTATTTIQCALQNLSQNLAEWDSTYYLGRQCGKYPTIFDNGEHSLSGDLKGNFDKGQGALLEAFQARLKHHRRHNHNVVLSMEGLSRVLLKQDLQEDQHDEGLMRFAALVQHNWNVRVVVTYRPYYEWIKSFYSQEMREEHVKSKFSFDYRHLSFQDYLERHLQFATISVNRTTNLFGEELNRAQASKALGHHLSVRAFRAYTKYFSSVHVFDLYQSATNNGGFANTDSVVTNFVCQQIPSAVNTCRYLQDNAALVETRFQNHKYDVSNPFDTFRILEAACDERLINGTAMAVAHSKPPSTRTKKSLSSLVQEELKRNIVVSMVSCLQRNVQEALFQASLSFEMELQQLQHENQGCHHNDGVPSNNKTIALPFQQQLQQHRSDFEKFKASGTFCEIRPDRVLLNPEWRQFLSNL